MIKENAETGLVQPSIIRNTFFPPSLIVFLEWCTEITKPYFKDFFLFLSQNKSLRQYPSQ